MRKQVAKGVGSLFRGLLLGILAVMLLIAGFIALSSIARAEAPDVLEHPTLEAADTLDALLVLDAALGDLDDTLTSLETIIEVDAALACEFRNTSITYRLEHIRKQAERQPKTAYIYVGAIKALEESRCEE